MHPESSAEKYLSTKAIIAYKHDFENDIVKVKNSDEAKLSRPLKLAA